MSVQHLANKFLRDKNNNLVIWQFPNLAIIGWFIFMLTAHFVGSHHLKTGFSSLSTAFLFTWSYLEITQGATYFRQALGGLVALYVILNYFH